MEKKVNIVSASFKEWVNNLRKSHQDNIIDALIDGVEEQVLYYLEEKRRKYIKIDVMNKAIFG